MEQRLRALAALAADNVAAHATGYAVSCAGLFLTLVLWMRNLFGFGVVLAWGVVLVTLARKGIANALRFLLSLLAIQVALNSVYDIRALFLIGRGQSDAATMARLFLLPSWVWAMSWMLISVALLGATLWMTRGLTVDRFAGLRQSR